MAETIEPHPLLVNYVQMSNSLWTEFDGLTELFIKSERITKDEWHYIMSNLEQNIFLLKRIEEIGILPKQVNMCDAGIGLGAALFDFYLQSKEMTSHKFTFSGVEKEQKYLDFFYKNLEHFWNGEINITKCDIMDFDFSEFNIVYSYSPFAKPRNLFEFYSKIASEIKPGSLIIENREKGLGLDSTLTRVDCLEKIKIDDIYIFRKK